MWQEIDSSLYQKFEFKNFDEAFDFMGEIAVIARELNHHPKIVNTYSTIELWLTSHDAGNVVTSKDTAFAKRVDQISNDSGKSHSKTPKSSKATLYDKGATLSSAKLYTDGGSRGNPGPSAIGYVILDIKDNLVKKEGLYIGITTNNQAEYQALQAGIEDALNRGVKEIKIYMDSMLVVNQVNGEWKVKHQELLPIYQSIKKLLTKFDAVTVTYVPRAMNHLADAMVNECLDNQ